LVALPLFGLWVHRFLKDYRTGIYAAAFVVALAIAMQSDVFRIRVGPVRMVSAMWKGALAGYMAGLIAYFVVSLIIPAGLGGLGRMLARDPADLLTLIAGSPVFLGGWVYGALVGVSIEWLRGRAEAASE
jgi:hypothetical protein